MFNGLLVIVTEAQQARNADPAARQERAVEERMRQQGVTQSPALMVGPTRLRPLT